MGWEQLVWTRERARREGVSRERLTRSGEFVRVVRDRYLELAWADDLRARGAAVISAVPPRSRLSHSTALELAGLPVPRGASGQLHVTVPFGLSTPVDRGLVGHRSAQAMAPYRLEGLPVTSLPRAWCDLAALGPSTADLVATGDALLHAAHGVRDDLVAVLAERPGGRGSALARSALDLLDARAESPQESRLRVVLTLAGLPTPAVQHVVRTESGRFVARVDLAWPESRVAVEYDGDHHRTPSQWAADHRRREDLERAGWVVVVVLAEHLHGPVQALVSRIRARLGVRSAA